MNSALSGSNMVSGLQPTAAAKGRSGPAAGDDLTDFKEVMGGQALTSEQMAGLRDALPPEQFRQLQSLLENGSGLPTSADIADPAALLQWVLQLAGAEGSGEEMTAMPGGRSTRGAALTAADLRGMLLQQGGGNPANGPSGQAYRPFNLAQDNQAALLLKTGEMPEDVTLFKPGSLTADLTAGMLKGPVSVSSLSTLVSGVEPLSAQRSEVYTPPPIPMPTGEKGWDNVLSNRIMWMMGNQMQQASLHITPRHLGPIDIQVSIQNDQASISFLAHNAPVKEALEAAIPRLREMFADNNMQLVNVDVGQHDTTGQQGAANLLSQHGNGRDFSANGHQGGEAGGSQAEAEPVRIITSSGLVDDYA